ncbi:hypothetical protein [Hafnia psychrotolerans]|uniref:Uncharacterized protein n=1 Tax=Hafnia psychrotolerans TaxID=1477018 RepID=A0ABQ1H5R6_9GAMM|nr:hypothetical protein [Hafnia psychrotolerans]GGA58312.1 hypothetical protein GCM10011328_37260 [Hafnia psychrotolerans]
MNDFSHLDFQSLGLQSSGPVSRCSPEQRWALALLGDNSPPEEQQAKPKHSNAHRIAVSQPAKNNPILALKLIDRGEPSERAIETLEASHRHLSNFTKQKMKAICSGWECMDTEDRNQEAFTYSTTHQDSNGYRAGFNAALKALEKHVNS